jgi:hypothetical protein
LVLYCSILFLGLIVIDCYNPPTSEKVYCRRKQSCVRKRPSQNRTKI